MLGGTSEGEISSKPKQITSNEGAKRFNEGEISSKSEQINSKSGKIRSKPSLLSINEGF
jgi:hypothetical protein